MNLLETVRVARASGKTLPGGREWGVGVEEAYRIQEALFSSPLKGYKLGLVSEAKQRQMGVHEPIFGRVLAGMLWERVNLSKLIQPRAEPEVAVVLRADLPPGVSPGRAYQAIGGYFLAVDILDSVWEGYRFTLPEVVADNASGGGFLLALRRLDRLPRGSLRLYLNGEKVAEGAVEALGDPGARLSWLAERVGGLSAGQVVFLGSPAAAVPLVRGVLELWGEGGVLLARVE